MKHNSGGHAGPLPFSGKVKSLYKPVETEAPWPHDLSSVAPWNQPKDSLLSSFFAQPSYLGTGYFQKPMKTLWFPKSTVWKVASIVAGLYLVVSRMALLSMMPHFLLLDLICFACVVTFTLVGNLTVELYPRGLLRITYGCPLQMGEQAHNCNSLLRYMRKYFCHYLYRSPSMIEIVVGQHTTEIAKGFNFQVVPEQNEVFMNSCDVPRLLSLSLSRSSHAECLPICVDSILHNDVSGNQHTDWDRVINKLTFPIDVDTHVPVLFILFHSIQNHACQWPITFRKAVNAKFDQVFAKKDD